MAEFNSVTGSWDSPLEQGLNIISADGDNRVIVAEYRYVVSSLHTPMLRDLRSGVSGYFERQYFASARSLVELKLRRDAFRVCMLLKLTGERCHQRFDSIQIILQRPR